MKLAPIILFVYNRPWHTSQTLKALANNLLADKSILYVFCDGPKPNATAEEIAEINEVRTMVNNITWCKELIVEERIDNLGLANSVIDGVTRILDDHGKAIILEDDILTGQGFLDYMNKALSQYQNHEHIFGVSAFKYRNTKTLIDDAYLLPIASSWSYGTWFRAWEQINFDAENLLSTIIDRNLTKKIDFGNYPFFEMLKAQVEKKIDSWAIKFYTSMFLLNGSFVFPKYSLVQNIGFDSSGTHCEKDDYFSKIELNHSILEVPDTLQLNSEIVKDFRKNFENRFSKAKKDHGLGVRMFNVIKRIIKE